MSDKQKNSQQKQHQPLGFRTPDNFRGATFNSFKKPAFQSGKGGFNPSTFKTQHKG